MSREPAHTKKRRTRRRGPGEPFWFYLTLVALLGVLAMRAWAAGDPARGHALARVWCSDCHAIDRNGPAKDSAPSFAAIAASGGAGQRAARNFLNAPHPPMPDFSLARSQIDDIVAYLDSLAPPTAR